MKKVFLISMTICSAILIGCNKDPKPDVDQPESAVEPVQPTEAPCPLKNGYLFFDGITVKKADIPENEVFPVANVTSSISAKSVKFGVKSTYESPVGDFKVNDYRFKLVAQMDALIVTLNGVDVPVQATHVKIDDKYAFVSYNTRLEPNIGGLVVYEYKVKYGTLEEATVEMTPVTSIRMPKSQINAIDYDGSKLYLAGATDDLKFFGKTKREDRAFLMVLELNDDRTFKNKEPVVKQLTSYQATSIRKFNDRIYITVGDGTNGPPPTGNWTNLGNGGLFIYDANNCAFVNSILGIEHARSVDVDNDYIYLYQANHARVTRYNYDASGKLRLYEDTGEAWQRDAKSEIMAWKDYLFVAENETGLRMLLKDGSLNQALPAPNFDSPDWNNETEVTNSMSMNSDVKKNSGGDDVTSDLLLVANGDRGIYWYDITKPLHNSNGKDYIVGSSGNNILNGLGSANYVTSKGNVVFVANGEGGLKVLYIGFNSGGGKPPISTGVSCMDFMGYLINGENNITPLLPPGASVFRNDAHPIVKQLFQQPSLAEAANVALKYIEIKKETELYITYLSEGAGWNNAMGYFVIPADVPKTDQAEYNYWNTNIKSKMYKVVNGINVLNDEFDGGGIIFNYIREKSNGGNLIAGNAYQIGETGKKFKPGERVVLFMCPDGWIPQNNRVEVTFSAGTTNQIFFMHKYFNEETKIPYSSAYNKGNDSFAGVQINSFYSADCKSMVLCIEDWHMDGTDVDFNDIIFSLSDNLINAEITSFNVPVWAIGKKVNGELEILPSKDILGK